MVLGEEWDRLVAATPDWIDPWCSREAWQSSTGAAFGGGAEPLVLSGSGSGWAAAVARLTLEDGTSALIGLDRVWGFGASVVGAPAPDLADALDALPGWQVAILPGGAPDSTYERALVAALLGADVQAGLAPRFRLAAGESTVRAVAHLDEGWWDRRSARFRQRLRQASARASIVFEICDGAVDFDRLLAIEAQSHKGVAGSGLTTPDMARLYRMLVAKGAANRCVVARHGRSDAGFILGGVHGGTYRGLQMSYVESAREWSVGNLLQLHEVTRHRGHRYDLGMDMAYKRHWADSEDTSRTIFVIRS